MKIPIDTCPTQQGNLGFEQENYPSWDSAENIVGMFSFKLNSIFLKIKVPKKYLFTLIIIIKRYKRII